MNGVEELYNEIIKLAEEVDPAAGEDFEPKLKEILGLTGSEDSGEAARIIGEIDQLVDSMGRFLIELRLGTSSIYGDKQAVGQLLKALTNIRWQLAMQL